MAVPNYTYLKLKMPGPKGVITIGSSFEHAYECNVECVERAEAQAEDEALAATLNKMASEALDSTHRHAGSFEPAEGIKKVPLDPSHSDDKALQIFAWSPSDMPGIPREVAEHSFDVRPNSKPVKNACDASTSSSAGRSARSCKNFWRQDSSKRYSIPSG